MKYTRTLFLLLFAALVALAPRMAWAQSGGIIINFVPDCGSQGNEAGWDFSVTNKSPDFIDTIKIIISSLDTSEYSFLGGQFTDDKKNNAFWTGFPSFTGDTLIFAGGILSGTTDSAFLMELGGEGQNGFPANLYDSTLSITWQAISGNILVGSGTLNFTPTIFQGNCFFDSASAASSLNGCDPEINFHVFDKNGETDDIDYIEFQLQNGLSTGMIRPSDIQAPPGWVLDSVTPYAVYFSGSLAYLSNLNGFMIGLRTNPVVDSVDFVLWFYHQGALIDRDTVYQIPTHPQQCSPNPSYDSLTFASNGNCEFGVTMKNYHSGDENLTVSPITEYTYTLTSPGVKWSSVQLPPEITRGTWQYFFLNDSTTIVMYVVPAYRYDTANAQMGGTIWTMKLGIDDPNPGENMNVSWSDSSFSQAVSSGTTTISCSNKEVDSVWLVSADSSDCTFSVSLKNQHTGPVSSIREVILSIPSSAGTFDSGASCFTSNNGWVHNFVNGGLEFSTVGSNLAFGGTETFNFCIDAISTNSWTLTVRPLDSTSQVIDTITINIPACAPPSTALHDSTIQFQDRADCADTLKIFNLTSTTNIDSITVIPSDGATVTALQSLSMPFAWSPNISPNGTQGLLYGGTIQPLTNQYFLVHFHAPTTAPFHFSVYTVGGGLSNTWSDTMSCLTDGVAENAAQIPLSVSVVPNPMTDEATITLTTGEYDHVQIALLDVLGRGVKAVADGAISAGDHSYTLDVSTLAPGTYYLRIQTSSQTVTKKLVVEH